MLKKVVAEMITLWIWLLAVLPGLRVNAVVVFEQRPGTTCGVKGGVAHLVWDYDDAADTVNVIRWYYGTIAGTAMGKYTPGTDTFEAYVTYPGNITFKKTSTALFKSAILTLSGLQDADEGNYTTRFQATPDIYDVSILEVAEASDLGTWKICANGICEDILGSLTLRASGNVTVQFTKNSALTCDMDIDVTPSVGDSCQMKVGAQDSLTAECDLGDAARLVAPRPLSIDLAFGKNGEVFYNDTDTIANITVILDATESTTAATTTNTNTTSTSPDTPGSPNTWNDLYVIPIVLGICIIVIIIVVVVVVRRRKKMETGRPHPQDRSSGVSVGASAAGMPPGGQPRHKAQPNPQSGAPSGDMAYKVGYVDPDAPALFHDDRYDSGFGNTGYAH